MKTRSMKFRLAVMVQSRRSAGGDGSTFEFTDFPSTDAGKKRTLAALRRAQLEFPWPLYGHYWCVRNA